MKKFLIGLLALGSISSFADISGIYIHESGHILCPNEIDVIPSINYKSAEIRENYVMGETREVTRFYENKVEKNKKDIFKTTVTPRKIESNHYKKKLFGIKSELYSSLTLEEFETIQGIKKLKRTTYSSEGVAAKLTECIYIKF